MEVIPILLLLVIQIPVYISIIFIPYWTRKTESFGVSIPEEVYFNNELKKMRKSYAWWTGILSIVVTIVFILSATTLDTEKKISLFFSGLLILYIISSFFIYIHFHKQMKQLKDQNNWVKIRTQQVTINTEFRRQKLTYSNLWFIVAYVLAFIMILITFQLYDRIPERIPTKYNFSGEVTNWSTKSYRSVLMMPIMQIYLTSLFLFINVMIAKAKQQISTTNPEDSIRRNIIFRRRWSLYTVISGIAMSILFSAIQASFIFPINQKWLVLLSIIISIMLTLGAILLAITTGQGGSRLSKPSEGQQLSIDRDDDKYWKLGQIYFNKDDPALFLEKRFGIGWTANMARPMSWVILLAIILLAIGIPLLLNL
ncbi:DUF1648 domain-containing protein [Virgibacillus halodenitrificans]|uniref:DUF1648 domain-containing protein n=1 Tax=Virgibacillus halodenitrificans TaxID=1482 RepID=UPI00045C780A|nr:DUF1648 domain-containing protein [Virgibacillus halodenitrificans]CDQ36705.1 putative membrane protein [Virgibacillus halodenitrificans]